MIFNITRQDQIVLPRRPFYSTVFGEETNIEDITSRTTTITTNWLRVLRNLHRFPTFSDRVATFYDRFRTPLRQREQCGDWFRTRQQEVSDFL